MSQATAKATRRAIRKAVGPEAIDVINSHAASITDLIAELAACNQRIAKVTAQCEAAHAKYDHLDAALRARDALTFWQRLQWLVTAR